MLRETSIRWSPSAAQAQPRLTTGVIMGAGRSSATLFRDRRDKTPSARPDRSRRTHSWAPSRTRCTESPRVTGTKSPSGDSGRTDDLAKAMIPDTHVGWVDVYRSSRPTISTVDGQMLHATFIGAKHPNADVENLVLDYMDSFKVVGGKGIRFEYGAAVPPAPNWCGVPGLLPL